MLPINPDRIPALYKQALNLQSTGRAEEALKAYSLIINAKPNLPEVHFQVGKIFYEATQYEKAATHLERARDLRPKELAIWSLYAKTLAAMDETGRITEFLKAARGAGLSQSDISRLQENFGAAKRQSRTTVDKAAVPEVKAAIAHLGANRADRAEAVALDLQRRYPGVAVIALILANAQVVLCKKDEAEANYLKSIKLDPNYAEAKSNYGGFLLEAGKIDEAIEYIQGALKLAPRMPQALLYIGTALERKRRYPEAEKFLRRALKEDPKVPIANWQLANVLVELSQFDEALRRVETAIKLGHRTASSYITLAKTLKGLGREDEAMAAFKKAAECAPENTVALVHMATLLQSRGDFVGAQAQLLQVLEVDPNNGYAYRSMVTAIKLKADDPLLQQMVDKFEDPELTDVERRELGFALAKGMEDSKQYDRVFPYLNKANGLMRAEFPYDNNFRRQEIDNIMKAFRGADFDRLKDAGYRDFAPIFVTGMPRSGTTLVEQIIASHSTVTAGGEVGQTIREAYKLVGQEGAKHRQLADVSPKEINELGRYYTDFMRNMLPGSDRTTDKSIQTYLLTGLIKLALPNSKIIVVRRDPRDNLLSIYKNVFPEGTHVYSYNLKDLAAYYKMFVEIIDFWRELNPNWFYEIQYEDLISNPEEESRKLIAACGLEWEDACLNFHQNKRRVDTLSVYQVRQPIYKSSFNLWEQYKDELGEMFEALK